jgi:uncharacterized tellurite resistance protein B-like protein
MRGLVQIVFGLVIGVIGAVWAGPANSMLAEPSANLLGDFAAAAPLALALAGGLYVVTGLITMVLSGIHNLMARSADKKAEARQLDLFHEILTGATVRMVGADGVIAPAELSMVSGVLEKFGQTPVPAKTITSIAQAAAKEPDRYLNLMSQKADSLTDQQKDHILRACLLVAMADVVLDAAELEYLNRIAQALKVPEERLTAIRDELTNVTSKLVGAAAFAA